MTILKKLKVLVCNDELEFHGNGLMEKIFTENEMILHIEGIN